MRQHLAFTGDLFPTSQKETQSLIKEDTHYFEFNRRHFSVVRDSYLDADSQEVTVTSISDKTPEKEATALVQTVVITKDGVIQHAELESYGACMWERPINSKVETEFLGVDAPKSKLTVTPRKLYPQRLLDTIIREQFLSCLPQYSDIAYSKDMARLWQYPTNILEPNLDISHPQINSFRMSLDLIEGSIPAEHTLTLSFINNTRTSSTDKRAETEIKKTYRIFVKTLNSQLLSDQKWLAGQIADFSRVITSSITGSRLSVYCVEFVENSAKITERSKRITGYGLPRSSGHKANYNKGV
jgi:hypothetical protein